MLGVADSRSGLTVLDLRQPEKDGGFHVLYHVPVEEIRNFQLVGDFVGVFHKFEPNVSFWNMMEQKTILCINIQVNEVLTRKPVGFMQSCCFVFVGILSTYK